MQHLSVIKRMLLYVLIGLVVVIGLLLVASVVHPALAGASGTAVVTNSDLDHGGRGADPNITGWSTVDMGCGIWQYSPNPYGPNKVSFAPVVINAQATPPVSQVSCAQKTYIGNSSQSGNEQNGDVNEVAYQYVCVFCVSPASGTFAGDHNPAHFRLVIQGKPVVIKVTWARTPCMLTGMQSACMNLLGTPIGKEFPLPGTQTPSP